jgi:3-oxoacyl-[acyl-carrier protein] reductase
MDLNLRNQKVLITGGSKGIGASIGHQFAQEGAHVILVARDKERLEAVANSIKAVTGATVETICFDVRNRSSAIEISTIYPDVDIVVNNAGDIPRGGILEIDDDNWRSAWDLKVFGYISFCREYYRLMKSRGQGVIINIIGAGGERPSADYVCGSSANAALMALTRALGGVSPNDGIRVVGVNPGPVRTERLEYVLKDMQTRDSGSPDHWQEHYKNMPFGRPAEPSDIASSVVFLASSKSAYTSGTVLTVSGGR